MNFRKSTFTRKFRIDIYRKGAFRNFLKMYVNPHYLEKVSKIEKMYFKFDVAWATIKYLFGLRQTCGNKKK